MSIEGRVPPHDLDAEAAVLSAIMLENDVLDIVSDVVRAECFYSDANRRIFEAAKDLANIGAPADIISIRSWLDRKGFLLQVGGAKYLAQIIDATPAVAHVEDHAAIIRDKWLLRETIAACQRIAAEGYGDVGDVPTFIGNAEAILGKLSDSTDVSDGIFLRDLIERRFKAIMSPEQHDKRIKVYTGIRSLDRRMGVLNGGDVLLIGAHSGVGKTSLATNMAVKIAGKDSRVCAKCEANIFAESCDVCGCEDVRSVRNFVAFFSPEMTEDELHDRIVFSESRAKMPFIDSAGRTHIPSDSIGRVAGQMGRLGNLPIKIYCDVFDMVSIRLRCLSLKRQVEKAGGQLAAIVIDYLQLVHPGGQEQKKSTNREQEVSAVSRMAKKLGKETGAVVILLAQLNDDTRKEKRKPKMSDIRESKAPGFDASKVVLIYNPAMEDRVHEYIDGEAPQDGLVDCVDLIVAKCRGGGRTGIVRVAFYPEHTLFDDWPDGVPMPENKPHGHDDDRESKSHYRR